MRIRDRRRYIWSDINRRVVEVVRYVSQVAGGMHFARPWHRRLIEPASLFAAVAVTATLVPLGNESQGVAQERLCAIGGSRPKPTKAKADQSV